MRKAKASQAGSKAGVSRFQAFTTETVHRSLLKGAPYNPRIISQRAKTKLKEAVQNVGLVQPIVWNKRTGNIVGGHQRISQLDSLEGGTDYRLTVAVVDLDETREREVNILLNNANVTGDWDFEKLKAILTQEDLQLLNTGFDQAEMMKLFGEAPSQGDAGHQKEVAAQLKALKDAYAKLSESGRHKDDSDFYNVVVFGSHEERKEFLQVFGFEDNRYIDGRTLAKVFLDLKETQLAAKGDEGKPASVGESEPEGTGKPG